MPLDLINEGEDIYEGKVTRAVKDADGDWWVELDGRWKCVTDRAAADDLNDIANSYGPLQDVL